MSELVYIAAGGCSSDEGWLCLDLSTLPLDATVQRKEGYVWTCVHYSWMLQFNGRIVMSGLVYIRVGCYSSMEGL